MQHVNGLTIYTGSKTYGAIRINIAISSPTPANIEAAMQAQNLWRKESKTAIKRKICSFRYLLFITERSSSYFSADIQTENQFFSLQKPILFKTYWQQIQLKLHQFIKNSGNIFSANEDVSASPQVPENRQLLLSCIQTTLSDSDRSLMESTLSET